MTPSLKMEEFTAGLHKYAYVGSQVHFRKGRLEVDSDPTSKIPALAVMVRYTDKRLLLMFSAEMSGGPADEITEEVSRLGREKKISDETLQQLHAYAITRLQEMVADRILVRDYLGHWHTTMAKEEEGGGGVCH